MLKKISRDIQIDGNTDKIVSIETVSDMNLINSFT
jgi:hypothetical protein